MTMNHRIRMKRLLVWTIVLGLYIVLPTSCLKDDTEEYQAEHDRSMENLKVKYGITEADLIQDGIYLHFTYMPDTISVAPVYAKDQYYVVIDLAGFDSENEEPFAVTDSATAAQYDIYRADLVYGPIRTNINNSFIGFYKAIQKMPEGSSAIILFPHDQAFGGYIPVVYRVKLYRVIQSYDEYLDNEFTEYMNHLGINSVNNMGNIQADSAYYKIVTEGDSVPEIETSDSVKIELHAYYVETDTAYVKGFPGRCFFPINDSGDTIAFEVGTTAFPITEIINSVVTVMKLGETREIITPATYAYGETGFVHPYVGLYIVPPYLSVHYTITLIDYTKYGTK